ncbi:uncharacterized protein [Parasteatoda tepidariorum]|uniref:uncharacterized protein n=1 Tax=Parasteatoda tepidariorum TaxID=114398 RepID=UPI001C725ABC|nr:uncharacterized protein LOC107436448 [Parasteatoda tepidariorum]
MSKEKHSRSVALELDYVREVYDRIGYDLSYAKDPLKNTVNKFLDNLEPGSIIADIGCGDGRHLRNDKGFYSVGADYSIQQTQLVRQRCHEAILGNNLYLPLRTESIDGVLSVGVIHHLSSKQRRIQALQELARVMRIGGKILITVRMRDPQHTQDVLMPWYDVIKVKKTKEDSLLTQDSGEGDLGDESGDSISLPSSDDEEDQNIISKINHSQRFLNTKQNLAADKKSKSLDCDFQYSNGVPNSQHSVPMQYCYNFVRNAFRRLSTTGADCISNNTARDMVDSAIVTSPTEEYGHQLYQTENTAIAWDDSIQKKVDDNYIELLNIDEQIDIPLDHQTKLIDETKLWCHSTEKIPKPLHHQKRKKPKRLIRSLSDAFKTIPSLWSSKEVKSCSDLKSQTISLQDIAKEGKIRKLNLARSKTTATCSSSFDTFQTLEEIKEMEMSVSEAEKIIDYFLESSVLKIETVKPNIYQPENQNVPDVSNSDVMNGNAPQITEDLLQNHGTLPYYNRKNSPNDICPKYPSTSDICGCLNKHKKYHSLESFEYDNLNSSVNNETLTSWTKGDFNNSGINCNKACLDRNPFERDVTVTNSCLSAQITNSLRISELSKLPLSSNLNDVEFDERTLKCNENCNNAPYHDSFPHQNNVLQDECLDEEKNSIGQLYNEQFQNAPILCENMETIDMASQNKLKVNRKFSVRSSSGQNISSKRSDSLQNTIYRTPYLKPIGPFYDAEPDDNSFLSTYTSMPELYNLSEFYQEYCIYKCTSKNRTSWDLFYNSIENINSLPSNSNDDVSNGDVFLKKSIRQIHGVNSASKKRKEKLRAKMLQDRDIGITFKNFGTENTSRTMLDKKLIRDLNFEIDNESVFENLKNYKSSKQEHVLSSKINDLAKSQVSTDINDMLAFECHSTDKYDVLRSNLQKTSILNAHNYPLVDTNIDKTSSHSHKRAKPPLKLNYLNSEMSYITNKNSGSSTSEKHTSGLKELTAASRQFQILPEFPKINEMVCTENSIPRNLSTSTSHTKIIEQNKSTNLDETRDSAHKNLVFTLKGETEISDEHASGQSTQTKHIKIKNEDFTSYSRMGTVGRKFSLNMSETMYNQHIDKKCEVCLQLTNNNLRSFKHPIQDKNVTEGLYQDNTNFKIQELENIVHKENVQTKLLSKSSSSKLPLMDHNNFASDYFENETEKNTNYISETDCVERHSNRNIFTSQTQNGAKPKHSSFINIHSCQDFAAKKQYSLNSSRFNSESKDSSKLRSKLNNYSQTSQENSTQRTRNKQVDSMPQNINYSYGNVQEEGASVAMHRYHHLFEQDELDDLIENFVDDLHILETFKDQFHWCIIAEKVRVWTI